MGLNDVDLRETSKFFGAGAEICCSSSCMRVGNGGCARAQCVRLRCRLHQSAASLGGELIPFATGPGPAVDNNFPTMIQIGTFQDKESPDACF
jgi:hypothetical protein